MVWLTVLVVVLLGISAVAFNLMISGALPSHRIETFSHPSTEEHAFEHRQTRLRAIDFVTVGLVVLVGVVAAGELLM